MKSAARIWLRSSAKTGSKFVLVTCFRGNTGTDDDDDVAAAGEALEVNESAKARDSARDSALVGRCLFISVTVKHFACLGLFWSI